MRESVSLVGAEREFGIPSPLSGWAFTRAIERRLHPLESDRYSIYFGDSVRKGTEQRAHYVIWFKSSPRSPGCRGSRS